MAAFLVGQRAAACIFSWNPNKEKTRGRARSCFSEEKDSLSSLRGQMGWIEKAVIAENGEKRPEMRIRTLLYIMCINGPPIGW